MDHQPLSRIQRAQRIQEESHWRIYATLTPDWTPPSAPSSRQTLRHDYLHGSPYELMDWYWCAERWGEELVTCAMRTFPAPNSQRIGVKGRQPGTFDFGPNPAPLLLATGHYSPWGPYTLPTGVNEGRPGGTVLWLRTETEESFRQSLDAIGYIPAQNTIRVPS